MLHSHNTDPSLVSVRDLDFSFPGRPIYAGLSMQIPKGKVTVIMGPSGCGKSTLLGLIGGRLSPSRGDVVFGGQSIPGLSRRQLYDVRTSMGMLFQSSALLTDLSVYDNVAFPLRENTNLPEPLIRILVVLKLEMVGLRGALDLMPSALSGGMARRVALARAIALDPLLVMYDEPFTGLDPISKGVTVKLIRELNDALGMTSIVVTHDVEEGLSIADLVYLITAGGIAEVGTPDQVTESQNPEVRQFLNGEPDGPVAYHYPAPDYRADLFGRK